MHIILIGALAAVGIVGALVVAVFIGIAVAEANGDNPFE